MSDRAAPDPSDHIGFLDEVEGRPKRKRRKQDDEELDLDRIW